ncbi:hypothetical protein J6590_041189 [Homalodisca vitripennis]|nr:hypothetical protein J6590_094916 [Homalodisca vitripennis]KAG8321737.1 hypothetical protein J6590_041189 [Homalodisca vitripennis]
MEHHCLIIWDQGTISARKLCISSNSEPISIETPWRGGLVPLSFSSFLFLFSPTVPPFLQLCLVQPTTAVPVLCPPSSARQGLSNSLESFTVRRPVGDLLLTLTSSIDHRLQVSVYLFPYLFAIYCLIPLSMVLQPLLPCSHSQMATQRLTPYAIDNQQADRSVGSDLEPIPRALVATSIFFAVLVVDRIYNIKLTKLMCTYFKLPEAERMFDCGLLAAMKNINKERRWSHMNTDVELVVFVMVVCFIRRVNQNNLLVRHNIFQQVYDWLDLNSYTVVVRPSMSPHSVVGVSSSVGKPAESKLSK